MGFGMDFLLKILPKGQGSYTVMLGAILAAIAGALTQEITWPQAVAGIFAALGFGTARRAMNGGKS
jgi:hypothetical protein